MLKDVISPVGCNSSIVVVVVSMGGPKNGASLHCDSNHVMEVLGGLGVDERWCLWASCAADCMIIIVSVAICSLIFCCL